MTPETVKMSQMRRVSAHELESRPGPPSRIFREIEADLSAELVRAAVLAGRRFIGWPTVQVKGSDFSAYNGYMGGLELVATVEAR